MKNIRILLLMIMVVFVIDTVYSAEVSIADKVRAFWGRNLVAMRSAEAEKIIKEMVKCPAGCFEMGSPSGELGRRDDEKQHHVTISKSFYIAKYPVTQAQYKAVMGNNPSHFKGDNNPVECVSWFKAKEFCDKLNEVTGSTRPAGYKFDLPTEAQWEYACRAGTTTSLNSGKNITNEYDRCSNLDEVGWYHENSENTHPVGLKKPNAWGIYDMHGNVWEWCSDWYGEYPSGISTDPEGPVNGSHRVYHGGSWCSLSKHCRSALRGGSTPGDEGSELGFRIALVPSSSGFKDSEAKIHECELIIDQIKARIEEERIRAEQRAEQERILVAMRSAEAEKIIKEMVKCPAGSFEMGSPSGELGRDGDEKQHHVTISKSFYIAKYPVTQAQYKAVMGNNPSEYKGDNYPVERVSWFKAKEFCDKLNEVTGSTRPAGYKFDLPTEAQWEYACRAGTTTSLNSGKNITSEYGRCSNLEEVGWYCGNTEINTLPVGLKKPNAWGIYDMHGNVCEWCSDWYGEYPSGISTDPEGPVYDSFRVCRGGSWGSLPRYCRSADRDFHSPDGEFSILGFRFALVPSSK